MTDKDAKTNGAASAYDQSRVPHVARPVTEAHGTIASGTGDTSVAPDQPAGARESQSLPVPTEFGRYKILRSLGQGAMGVVYLAEDTQLQRQVALKIPQLEATTGSARLERFYREARLAATLGHPNLCPVYDVGEFQGTHFISMAYIEGKSLDALLKSGKPQSERAAAGLVRKVALALEEAHSHGVIHRDLKPANIMVDQRGEPVVMDFGLARQMNSLDQAQITHSGAIIGTPSYMSPEQVQGKIGEVGAASDIYGLGVILYQLLTGRLPFQGSMVSILAQIATQTPAPPSSFRDRLSPEIEAICLQAMAKGASDRFASMAEFAAALTQYLRTSPGRTDQSRTGGAERGVASASAPPSASSAELVIVPVSDAGQSPAADLRKPLVLELCAKWRGNSPLVRIAVPCTAVVIVLLGIAVMVLSHFGKVADISDSLDHGDSGTLNSDRLGALGVVASLRKTVEIDYYEPPGLAGEWRPLRDIQGNVIAGEFPFLSIDNLELLYLVKPSGASPFLFECWYTHRASITGPFGEPVRLATLEVGGNNWMPTFNSTNSIVFIRGALKDQPAGMTLHAISRLKLGDRRVPDGSSESIADFPNAGNSVQAVFAPHRRLAIYDPMGSDAPHRAMRHPDGSFEAELVNLPKMIPQVQSDITPVAVGNNGSVVFTMDVDGAVWVCISRTLQGANEYGPMERLFDLHGPFRGGSVARLSRNARLLLSHDNHRELIVMRIPEDFRRRIVDELQLEADGRAALADEPSRDGNDEVDESTDAQESPTEEPDELDRGGSSNEPASREPSTSVDAGRNDELPDARVPELERALERARADRMADIKAASELLLRSLDKKHTAAQKSGNARLVEQIAAERDAFESVGKLPMVVTTTAYQQAFKRATRALTVAIGAAQKEYIGLGRSELARKLDLELGELKQQELVVTHPAGVDSFRLNSTWIGSMRQWYEGDTNAKEWNVSITVRGRGKNESKATIRVDNGPCVYDVAAVIRGGV